MGLMLLPPLYISSRLPGKIYRLNWLPGQVYRPQIAWVSISIHQTARASILGCPPRTKFWSSDFCFAPKLNLGQDNFNFFRNFPTSGYFTPMSSKISIVFLYDSVFGKRVLMYWQRAILLFNRNLPTRCHKTSLRLFVSWIAESCGHI